MLDFVTMYIEVKSEKVRKVNQEQTELHRSNCK